MLISLVVHEAMASIRSSAGRTLAAVAAVSTLMAGIGLIEGITAVAWQDEYRSSLRSGADVVVISRVTGADIDPQVCASLGRTSVVTLTGGIGLGGIVHSQAAPGVAFQTVHVSGDAFEIVAGIGERTDPSEHLMAVGQSLAEDLGLVVGSNLMLDNGDHLRVGAIGEVAHRAPEQSRWLYVPGADRVEQCWVEFAPGGRDSGVDAVRAQLSQYAPDYQISSLLAEASDDALEGWSARPSRFGWIGGSIGAIVLTLLVWIPRRREFALRRSLGQAEVSIAFQAAVEGLVISMISLVVAGSWTAAALVLLGSAEPVGFMAGFRQIGMVATVWGSSFVIVAFALMRGEPLGRLKED